MSHISVSHVTRVSCHNYHVNEWDHTYGWVIWHIWINYARIWHIMCHMRDIVYPQKWVASAVCRTYTYVGPNTASTSHHLRWYYIHICIYVYTYHITICRNIMYMHTCVYIHICITSPFTYCIYVRTCICIETYMYMYIFDRCCFYYFVRNSLVALLEALCARIFSLDSL